MILPVGVEVFNIHVSSDERLVGCCTGAGVASDSNDVVGWNEQEPGLVVTELRESQKIGPHRDVGCGYPEGLHLDEDDGGQVILHDVLQAEYLSESRLDSVEGLQ